MTQAEAMRRFYKWTVKQGYRPGLAAFTHWDLFMAWWKTQRRKKPCKT